MADEMSTTTPVRVPTPNSPTEPSDANHVATQATAKPNEGDTLDEASLETAPVVPEAKHVNNEAVPSKTNATTASAKKEKRKSTGGGVPEHKRKALGKKKSMPILHLDCQPGDLYWAKLKGHSSWPGIICDEQMLPESLLASRPVSTARPDGSVREDFKPDGKNAKERTFPVMFFATNEFAWMINTALTPLNPEECKTLPSGRIAKDLQQAWEIAAQNPDLDYFKNILKGWQEEKALRVKEMREAEEEEARLIAEGVKQKAADASTKKKAGRKSKGGDGDVDMEDAPKSTKKRKNGADNDADKPPKKTPKVTKINAPKTPNGDASGKKSASKTKKKVVQAPPAQEEEQAPQMTEDERLKAREQSVFFLRHKLQRGLLARDHPPDGSEMEAMADWFTKLEHYEDLEATLIRTTKIHKVLKAIVKLSSIPKDEVYHFKRRSAAMLEIWNHRMESDAQAAKMSTTAEEQGTGEHHATEAAKDDTTQAKAGAKVPVEESGAMKVAFKSDDKSKGPASADENVEPGASAAEKVKQGANANEKMGNAAKPSAEAVSGTTTADPDAMDTSADGETSGGPAGAGDNA